MSNNTSQNNIIYGYFIRCFTLLSFVSWFITITFYAYNYSRITFLEAYWNLQKDEKFYDKLRDILDRVNPAIISSENIRLDKIDEIYVSMNAQDKSIFRINIFENGMKPRIKKMIPNYR